MLRISPLEIDISLRQLGLDDKLYYEICDNADVIVHAAAYVNHFYDYTMHRDTNVLGTFELLKICNTHKSKRFIFISTSGCNDIFKINDSLSAFSDNSDKVHGLNGYLQSKLVCEKLIMKAISLSYDARVIRTGYIGPHEYNCDLIIQDNHVSSLLTMAMFKNICPNWKHDFECLPVNYIAKNIVDYALSTQKNINKLIKLSNSNTVKWVEFFRLINPDVKIIEHAVWYESILLKASETKEAYLYKIIPLYSKSYPDNESNLKGDFYYYDYEKIVECYKQAIEAYFSNTRL